MRRGWLGLLAVTLLGCAPASADQDLSPHGLIGREVEASGAPIVPGPLPDVTFTDTSGEPYRLADHLRGKVVLLFFGFTNCPDICPAHLSNLGAVLKRVPDAVAREVAVVFVTVDPVRDSLPVLAAYVRGFHPAFIGLTGSDSVLALAQHQAGIAHQAQPVNAAAGSDYAMAHAAQVIAYTADGLRRAHYPFGTRQKDWAHDLPRLIDFRER